MSGFSSERPLDVSGTRVLFGIGTALPGSLLLSISCEGGSEGWWDAATGVRCEFLVPVFWGLGTVVFRVVGTGPRGTSARAVSLSRLGWSGRWLYACRSLRYGFGGRC